MELLNKKPNVLCILDDFSFTCFKPECENLIPFDSKSWKQQISHYKFDFLLCESTWKPIGNHFTLGNSETKVKIKLFYELKYVILYCKQLKIPTVFWNKEDNVHYNIFKLYASLFDHIFTTDNRTINLYKKECKNAKTVDTMIFAAQPLIHNPIGIYKYEGDVFFAGEWYKFPERMAELEEILQLPNSINLHIYERNLTKDKKSKFPAKFRNKIRYGLNYIEMSEKYKKYPVMLNANSVKGSNTMFSRRVPEALLCGISVISSPSISIQTLFPHVFIKKTKQEVSNTIYTLLKNSEIRQEHNHIARRHILLNHLYSNRMNQICQTISIQPPSFKTGVVNLTLLSDNKEYNNLLLDDIKNQTYENIVCTLDNLEKKTLKNLFNRKLPDGKIDESIGFICLFHYKNRYEPNYILDSILSYKYFKKIDIIGKACYYSWDNGVTVINPELENSICSSIHPHTITISLAGDNELREKKLNYLLGILENKNVNHNLDIFSSDKYNFIYIK